MNCDNVKTMAKLYVFFLLAKRIYNFFNHNDNDKRDVPLVMGRRGVILLPCQTADYILL